MEHKLAWILKVETIDFLNNDERNLVLQLMVFHVPWKIECWYFDSYNWEWNIVVKPTDIGCRALTLKTAAKRSPIYIRLTSNVLCPVFFILGKNQHKIEFHKYEIIVSWTFNSKICLQLSVHLFHWKIAKFHTKHVSSCKTDNVTSNPKYFHTALKEIFPTSYQKYFFQAIRNISYELREIFPCCIWSAAHIPQRSLADRVWQNLKWILAKNVRCNSGLRTDQTNFWNHSCGLPLCRAPSCVLG